MRTITIVVRDVGGFDVSEGTRFCSELTWDEMLGQIARLTMPERNPLFHMESRDEWREREDKLRKQVQELQEKLTAPDDRIPI